MWLETGNLQYRHETRDMKTEIVNMRHQKSLPITPNLISKLFVAYKLNISMPNYHFILVLSFNTHCEQLLWQVTWSGKYKIFEIYCDLDQNFKILKFGSSFLPIIFVDNDCFLPSPVPSMSLYWIITFLVSKFQGRHYKIRKCYHIVANLPNSCCK